jgi:hypothetical protein
MYCDVVNESDRALGEERAFISALSTAHCESWTRYELGRVVHLFSSLSDDRSRASSKASSSHTAI